MITLNHYLAIGVILFAIGIIVVITKKNAIVVLMGIELMLNAVNINMVAFSYYDPDKLQGQFFALFIMVVAAAEAAVALAIVLKVYSYYQTANLNEIKNLKD